MTWTYNVAQIGTSKLYQVRRLIGDVIQGEPQLQDEEINFALTQRPSIYGAAADCCRYISGQFSRKTDVVTGELKENYSQQAKAYATQAAMFENRSLATGGGLPFAGGISIVDKQNREQDTDRVPPQYQIGMEDNLLPIGPAGNESSVQQEGQ